jgi:predicted kinase
MERIPAPDRTREKLKALMEGRSEVADGCFEADVCRAHSRRRTLARDPDHEFEQRQLRAIREEIDKDFAARNAPAATAPQPHLSSNQRT